MDAPEVVLFIGLPGAGKSTFYRTRFASTHVQVSKDLMPRSARHKSARQLRQIEAALAEGRSVVVDNTNVTRADREPVIAKAHELGARAVGFWFRSSPRDSMRRNAGRQGRARVPDAAIRGFARRFETPAFEEGFDALFAVHTLDEGGFAVEPIEPAQTCPS